MSRAALRGTVLCLGLSGAAAPADARDALELRAILESVTTVQTADGELQSAGFVLEPELTAALGDSTRLTATARLRADFADQLEPGRPDGQDAFRSSLSRRLFIGEAADLELREFYLDRYLGDVFIRLGKQQVVWGQADGLRVLDLVNPLELREFILPEFEDRRIPLWMANIEVPVGPVTAQFLWIPDHSYDDVPEAGATYAFSSPRVVPRPPSQPGGPVVVEDARRPDRFLLDDDFGLRLTAFLGGWDLSLNYLHHYADQAVWFRRPLADGISLTPEYERTHTLGGSLSNAFGDLTLRGEIAYSTDRFYLTRDPADSDGVIESGELGYVLGLDYQHGADWLLSGQLFQSILTERPAGTVRDRIDSQVTMLVRREFRNDTLALEVLAIHSLNDGDGLVQAGLEYAYRSNIVLALGADVFYGPRQGLFGEFGETDRITLGVEFGL